MFLRPGHISDSASSFPERSHSMPLFELIGSLLGGGADGGVTDIITGDLLDGLLDGLLGDSTGSFGSS